MKINEACKRTGLSERAIRFYVEKGLLEPKSQIISGRTTTEYSESDIEILRDIATLRNAEFSIADILAMQKSDNDVCRIIEKHCSEFEQEQVSREKLIHELKDLSKRGVVSWRKVSAVLSQKREDYNWQGMRLPEEEACVDQTEKRNLGKWGVLLFFIVLIIFVFTYNKHNNKILTAYFSIDDVVVEQKWTRGEDYYLSIYSAQPNSDVEAFFKSPRTMQTGAREYYEAMQITGEAYDSFEIRIEISYADAREEGILDKNGELSIEKALEIDRVVRDYCFIEKINNN